MAAWEVPGFVDVRDGVLHVDGVSAVQLAEHHGTPLFVISEARIRHNADELRRAFERRAYRTRIFYASKANSNLSVLRVVRDAGLDVEVNSGGELYKVLRAGFEPRHWTRRLPRPGSCPRRA